MKKLVFVYLLLSLQAYSSEYYCSGSRNYTPVFSKKININNNKKTIIGHINQFEFSLRKENNSVHEIEVYDSNTPSRQYVKGPLTKNQTLEWALWSHQIYLEIKCSLTH